jgi:hypothetical protein
MGLSLLCKIPAVWGILAVLLHWAISRRHEIFTEIRQFPATLKQGFSGHSAIWDMAKLLIAAVLIWIVLLPLLEYPAAHQFANPFSRTQDMLNFHLSITATPYQNATTPWTWVLSPSNLIYWPDPIFVAGNYVMVVDRANPLWWASIGWNIWPFIVLAIGYLTYEAIRYRRAPQNISIFALSWFFAVYILLIPLAIVTSRLMYTYYFYPAIPAVCIAIAWSAWQLWSTMKREKKRKNIFLSILGIYILSVFVIFFLMSPYGGHFLFHN